jgi:hypothetical protein
MRGEFEELMIGTPEVGVADRLPERRHEVIYSAQVLGLPSK